MTFAKRPLVNLKPHGSAAKATKDKISYKRKRAFKGIGLRKPQ